MEQQHENDPDRHPRWHLALLAAITLTVVYWPYATADRLRRRYFDPKRGGRGRAGIYLANGCVYCHSQSIRAFDWGHGAERIAQSGDYIADEPIALGSQRTGWISPRRAASTRTTGMLRILSTPGIPDPAPSCRPLSGWACTHRHLTQYIQSLGSGWPTGVWSARNTGRGRPSRPTRPARNQRPLAGRNRARGLAQDSQSISDHQASLQRGQIIYQKFCIGCHGPIGDGMGPAQPWIYPPPLTLRF